MNTSDTTQEHKSKKWWQLAWVKGAAGTLAVLLAGCFVAAEYALHHIGPIVKKRVVATLSAYFHAPVTLDDLQISLVRGVEVEGKGLRVPYMAGMGQDGEGTQRPLVTVETFAFRTTIKGLLHEPTQVALVRMNNVELHLPPKEDRGPILNADGSITGPTKIPNHFHIGLKSGFLADEVQATNVKLVIETNKPTKAPLEFDVGKLNLQHVGTKSPMTYQADLINPKPVGEICATGHFGPWNADDPRETFVDGDYSFDHADLSTIKGLGGTLSSTGHFTGALERITVDGTTDTPDFSLDISGHPVPLKTVFHAYVDGTNGDTTLDPVQGKLRNSDFVARGKIENIKGQGHDISLDAVLPRARMEDVLDLGVKTSPPLMRGALAMKVHIHIPPGKERVSQKLELTGGTMKIQNVVFQKPKWQDKIDGLSMRAQGKPEDAKEASTDKVAEVNSTMSLNFNLGHGQVMVDNLDYEIPGAHVLMNGVYSMDGKVFEFKGHVRTDAKPSQMVTGWKSILLMPVDHFLKKEGAGMELPIAISGTDDDVHFGLAMHGSAEETSQQIAQSMKTKPSTDTPKDKKKVVAGDSR